MKKTITALCLSSALFAGICLPMSVNAEPVGAKPEGRARLEKHPEIHQAIHALEKAKIHLEKADHDFSGHRQAAIAACDQAIAQLRLCLEGDRR
jgi:hypothetical protein